jgi:tetratricopeptide (TPR) repeat protein
MLSFIVPHAATLKRGICPMRRSLPALQLVVTIAALLAALPLAAQQASSTAPSATSLVKGMQAVQNGKYATAIPLLQAVVQADATNEPAWYNLGVAKFNTNDYPGALDAFKQALNLYGDRFGTRLYIGRIYESQGAYQDAIVMFSEEARRAMGANMAQAKVALARTYYKAASYTSARDTAHEATRAEPKFIEAMYIEGLARTKLKDYDGAIAVFKQAHDLLIEYLDLSNALHSAANNPGAARERTQTEESLAQEYNWAQDFAQKLGLWPALNKALGDAYLGNQDFMPARSAYRKAADLNEQGSKSDPDVYVRVARADLADAKDQYFDKSAMFVAVALLDDGDQQVDQALALDAKNAPAYEIRGEIYAFQAQTYDSAPSLQITSHSYDDAQAAFNKALQATPNYPEAMTGLAEMYLSQAQLSPRRAKDLLQKALGLLQQALTLEPDNARDYVLLAEIALVQGQYTDARANAEKALTIEPKNDRAYNVSGLANYFTGQLAQAIRDFRKALEFAPHNGQYYFNLANAYFQLQSWYLARHAYEQAFFYTPSAVMAKNGYQRAYILYMTALTYHETRSYDEEIAMINRSLAIDISYFDAYMQLARAYSEKKEYRGAQRALEQAGQRAATNRDNSQVFTLSAQVYEAAGDVHAAATAYATALSLDNTNVVAQAGVARLTGRQG